MDAIFIDSNGFLSFYRNESVYYKQLLHQLRKLKNRIFVTSQVVYEVERNRCRIFKNYQGNYFQLSQIPDLVLFYTMLPLDEEMEKWERKRQSIRDQIEDWRKELEEINRQKFSRTWKTF